MCGNLSDIAINAAGTIIYQDRDDNFDITTTADAVFVLIFDGNRNLDLGPKVSGNRNNYSMKTFNRRIYTVPGFFSDISEVIRHPHLAMSALWGTSLTAHFRQRLMLAVTAVHGCRYCSYLHTREALRAGLSQEEVNVLLSGMIENVPADEAKAILYAQHWADNSGKPDPEAHANLIQTYGLEKTRVIEMALLLIRIGNLSGNSFDYLLFRLSRGRFGLTKRDQE